jgi:hypothetical protein
MGQYFKACNVQTKECIISWDFNDNAKLMEHSWNGNKFVNVAEKLLAKGGKWFGQPFCWSGDYAENEEGESQNLYEISNEKAIKPKLGIYKKFRYLLNVTTKVFVDLEKVPVSSIYENYEYRIHALPLLTCEGNQRGGGDFYGEDPNNLVGSWARCIVEPTNIKPTAEFTELIFDLKI